MSVPSAGKLRMLRDQRAKPVRFKVELTLDQIRVARLALERFALLAHPLGPDTMKIAQELSDKLDGYLKKFGVLNHAKCLRCGSVVPGIGGKCLRCEGPGVA